MSNITPVNTYREMTPEELHQRRLCQECWNKPQKWSKITTATHMKHVVIKGRYEYDEPVCIDCVPVTVVNPDNKTYVVSTQEDTVVTSAEESE